MADKLKSEDAKRAREVWTKLGQTAFEADRPASAHSRQQLQQDRT
jgi:hypothetical protein